MYCTHLDDDSRHCLEVEYCPCHGLDNRGALVCALAQLEREQSSKKEG